MSRLDFIIADGNLRETIAEQRRKDEKLFDDAQVTCLSSGAMVIAEYAYQPNDYTINVSYGNRKHLGDYQIRVLDRSMAKAALISIYVPADLYIIFENLVEAHIKKLEEDINL